MTSTRTTGRSRNEKKQWPTARQERVRSGWRPGSSPVQSGPGTFSKIDVPSREIVSEQAVGNRPSEVLVDHDIAYVSVRVDNVVRAYDIGGDNPELVGAAEANFSPDTLSLTNDGRTLIVGLRGTPARMAFIDTKTLATQYLSLPGTTTGHQWLSRDGAVTFIALEGTPGKVAWSTTGPGPW